MPPQPQPNQGDILALPPTLQNFAGVSVPPLDRARFLSSYRHFCLTKKLSINEAALNIYGKQVDLYTLHEEVLNLRATGQVSSILPNLMFLHAYANLADQYQILASYWIQARVILR